MVDIASQKDKRGIYLDEVGVTGVKIPIRVKDRTEKRPYQYTIGTFDAFVELEHDQRGTHMSRIVEAIYNNRENINQDGLQQLAWDLAYNLDNAQRSNVKVTFPYFIDRNSPVSRLHNLMTYQARFEAGLQICIGPSAATTADYDFRLGATVDVMTVCPCALEECKSGASHVQRGQVNIDVKPKEGKWVWLEDLIDIAETAASSPVYERLKRKDEVYVVSHGFEFPRFVEDVVRECIVQLQLRDDIDGYCVSCENFESIHQHNAYARRYRNWNHI